MLKSLALLPVLAVAVVPARAEPPGDTAAGKKLHDANCLSCHDDGVYKRQNRTVKSLGELSHQIGSCGHAAAVTLGKSQANDLVKYLNDTYYRFK